MKKAKLFMDTVVEIQVESEQPERETEAKVDRAFEAFRIVESACSRFQPDSELMKACRQIGTPVPLSPYVFHPLRFAMEIAERTEGAFDPTVGKTMEQLGFNRHYLTGALMDSLSEGSVTYRDIVLNDRESTLLFKKPMVIDLGAVAKGFAIDLAANELKEFERFSVNAGGDLYAGGSDSRANVWKIGIRHPAKKDRIIETVEVSNEAVCTSGSYERRSTVKEGAHHIVDPKAQHSPRDWISCSVVAPFAMLADGFSTAAFAMGSAEGKDFVEEAGLKGIWIAPDMKITKVGGI
ncbi:FAD:protein FMN transferase [Paenibacillus sp. OV219]|uniref:FAD:protein FMN transferase n=1 Tax=Paenibacillus sp. OV219 TaxID=1884377 RepID=UPI0008C4AD92|nr:FAD:protein FMN transferase [Paenibacillus sp. OV219]SEM92565.1 thiamine biosynthesis lipoprotein [Paenibacillus sp. OV219]